VAAWEWYVTHRPEIEKKATQEALQRKKIVNKNKNNQELANSDEVLLASSRRVGIPYQNRGEELR